MEATTTTCGACTHENRTGSFFCSQCGTKLHFAASTTARLVRMNGVQLEKKIEISGANCVIGRSTTANIVLEHESVSKQHACIRQRDGRFFLEDLESSNGTYVNGRRVREELEIRSGDLLRLGSAILKFET